MRSAMRARFGLSTEARSIRATMAAKRVSRPRRCTRTVSGLSRLWLPAMTASPVARAKGVDSPVSRASSTRLAPSSIWPSAGKLSPGSTRTRSPTARRRTGTRSKPRAPRRSMLAGRPRIRASSAPAVRSRRRCSSRRPDSRKKTNMVTESYQTSRPQGPEGSKVAAVLAAKAISRPRATGTSMPMRR